LGERFERPSLDPRYHGVYLARAVARCVDDPAALFGDGETSDLPQLYPLRLAGDVERLREPERELAQLRALDAGIVEVAGASIRYRGDAVPRRELPALTERVRADRDAVRDRLEAHDRRVRGAHLAAARAADARVRMQDPGEGARDDTPSHEAT